MLYPEANEERSFVHRDSRMKKTHTLLWNIFVCYGGFRNNLTPVLEEKIKMTGSAVRS